ncbi:MAG: molecular chaperone HtpG, partial [Clostridiales bacterium]|nr:molecular chaperone HtpG [Clostridiales bacterium]
FKAFGLQLKYGIVNSYGINRDKLESLLMFYSPKQEKLITLSEYVEAMPEDQKYIYYACGSDAATLDKLPQAELIRDRGFDTFYMTDPVDEFVVRGLVSHSEKEFRSVTADDLGLLSEDETKKAEESEEENRELLDFVVESLDGKLAAATLSTKLVSAPVCLTTRGGVTLEMERYFNAMRMSEGQEPVRAERVLELNASHNLFGKLKSAFESDKGRAAKYAELLYYQSVVMAGLPPEDPVRFCELISELTS